jgi:hypothetical protein
MKQDSMVAIILFVSLLWNIVIAFGFWGGYPEGCFKQIRQLQEQNYRAYEDTEEFRKEFLNHRHQGIYGKVK